MDAWRHLKRQFMIGWTRSHDGSSSRTTDNMQFIHEIILLLIQIKA